MADGILEDWHAKVQEEAFDQGTKIAQIFSGIFFSGLATWLMFANATKLAFVQRASLEKRLTVCCFINTYVGFFSAFFNIFQLTDVDDMLLPSRSQFTLDLSRPIEWVLTCPMMQLVLVLMGGAKIPEYRRYAMPMFSVVILGFGTASMFMPSTITRALCYVAGVMVFIVMASFNRRQIVEYSNGEEDLLSGDSEYRKASLLLIATWAPFPTWFSLSPEGFGVIDNVLLIQVGWAFLNIVAKFSFIFYIQRIKDLYCSRLKTKRELVGVKGHGFADLTEAVVPDADTALACTTAEGERQKEKLGAVVVETMTFLGMAQHSDRFLQLLERAEITSLSVVENLSKEDCERLQVPYDLVSALQRRLRVWKLEMVDDAEVGLEKGEEHYLKKIMDEPPKGQQGTPNKKVAAAVRFVEHSTSMSSLPGAFEDENFSGLPRVGLGGSGLPGSLASPRSPRSTRVNVREVEACSRGHREASVGTEELAQKFVELLRENSDALLQRFQSDLSSTEKRLASRIDATTKTTEQRTEVRAMEHRLGSLVQDLQKKLEHQGQRLSSQLEDTLKRNEHKVDLQAMELRMSQHVDQQLNLVMQELEGCSQKVEGCSQKVEKCSHQVDTCSQKLDVCVQKVDATSTACSELEQQQGEASAGLLAALEEATASGRAGTEQLLQQGVGHAKLFAESEAGLRQRLDELENSMVCRDDEQETSNIRRNEELSRQVAGHSKRFDELAGHVQRVAERAEAASQGLGSGLAAELQAVAAKLASKAEGLHASACKQSTEMNEDLQRRLDQYITRAVTQGAQKAAQEAAQRAEKAVESLDKSSKERLESSIARALSQASQQGAAQVAQRAEAAVELLGTGMQKRLDEAMLQAVAQGSQKGAQEMAQRTQKAMEALEASQRDQLTDAMTNLVQRVDANHASQTRLCSERDERASRLFEELTDLQANRAIQACQDVGVDMKKELHGFAKRLNSKIPFL